MTDKHLWPVIIGLSIFISSCGAQRHVAVQGRVSYNPSPVQGKASYYGSPQFMPLEGTSLFYAANAKQKVIRFDDVYYLWAQGIWFASQNASGPWATSSLVPLEVLAVECAELGFYHPLGGYQLCAVVPSPPEDVQQSILRK